jgi:hypothetical protein
MDVKRLDCLFTALVICLALAALAEATQSVCVSAR